LVSERLRAYFLIEGSPLPLALFRIALGVALVIEATQNLKRVSFYTPQTFHFPYFQWITPLSEAGATTLFTWQLVFAVCFGLGLLTRVSAVGVLATQGYAFLICALNFRNHVYLELLMTTVMLFSACGAALSIDALARWAWRWWHQDTRPALHPTWVPITAQRVIGLQICIVYLYATLHKANPGFLSGYPLSRVLPRAIRKSTVGNWLFSPETIQAAADWIATEHWSALAAWLTVGAEGFLAFGLLFRPTRLAAVCVGIGLHLGIGLTMDIVTFGVVMTAAYICFWIPRTRAQGAK
jgi:hypothetical protein